MNHSNSSKVKVSFVLKSFVPLIKLVKTTLAISFSKTPLELQYEYNPSKPQKCLEALNQELKKDYQIDELVRFVTKYKDDIDTVEIIGHNLGEVDEQYFEELNKLIPRNAIINYWLFDECEEEEKKAFLNSNFHGHPILIKTYPEE